MNAQLKQIKRELAWLHHTNTHTHLCILFTAGKPSDAWEGFTEERAERITNDMHQSPPRQRGSIATATTAEGEDKPSLFVQWTVSYLLNNKVHTRQEQIAVLVLSIIPSEHEINHKQLMCFSRYVMSTQKCCGQTK